MPSEISLPIIFIVTPSLNQSEYLEQNLHSVLQQASSEYVIVHHVQDGKSTDGTITLLSRWLTKHSNIKNYYFSWVSKKDSGQTNAINQGIAAVNQWLKTHIFSREVYFTYLNSDDASMPGALESVISVFAKNQDSAWIVGDAKIINQIGSEIHQVIRWAKTFLRFFMKFGLFKTVLTWSNPIPQPSVFIRFSAVKQIGLFNETLSYVMDYEYWWRAYEEYGIPKFVSRVLSQFRVHSQSKGGLMYKKQFTEELSVSETFNANRFLIWWHSISVRFIILVYQHLKG